MCYWSPTWKPLHSVTKESWLSVLLTYISVFCFGQGPLDDVHLALAAVGYDVAGIVCRQRVLHPRLRLADVGAVPAALVQVSPLAEQHRVAQRDGTAKRDGTAERDGTAQRDVQPVGGVSDVVRALTDVQQTVIQLLVTLATHVAPPGTRGPPAGTWGRDVIVWGGV